ncbi:hypothetical protein SapgrDRAFT_2973 [Saprospira grandis DSM 2844]|uniref:Uncharacterized protein n=1 Tax=Saprospira grandis DSM 2844 TaxID=694433 RepID=J0PAK4_9BACT|nr:hypothetical protein SapgrDRAFT_2973 [Saprospira grandis DSM 2844]
MSQPPIFCKNTKNFKQVEQLSLKMPNFSKISLFLVKFWGCPALQAGRAVSQLAVRSALRFFRYAQKAGSGLRPLLSIPQPLQAKACRGPIFPLQNYPIT